MSRATSCRCRSTPSRCSRSTVTPSARGTRHSGSPGTRRLRLHAGHRHTARTLQPQPRVAEAPRGGRGRVPHPGRPGPGAARAPSDVRDQAPRPWGAPRGRPAARTLVLAAGPAPAVRRDRRGPAPCCRRRGIRRPGRILMCARCVRAAPKRRHCCLWTAPIRPLTCGFVRWARQVSNLQPTDYESAALTS